MAMDGIKRSAQILSEVYFDWIVPRLITDREYERSALRTVT